MDAWTDQSLNLHDTAYPGIFGPGRFTADDAPIDDRVAEAMPCSWAKAGERLILWLGQAIAQANHARSNLSPDRLTHLGADAAETVVKIQLDLLHAARATILNAQQAIRDQFTVVGELVICRADGALAFGDFALVKGDGAGGVCITSAAGTFLRTANGAVVQSTETRQDLESHYLPPSLTMARMAGIG